jgi:hypothetical protein
MGATIDTNKALHQTARTVAFFPKAVGAADELNGEISYMR